MDAYSEASVLAWFRRQSARCVLQISAISEPPNSVVGTIKSFTSDMVLCSVRRECTGSGWDGIFSLQVTLRTATNTEAGLIMHMA